MKPRHSRASLGLISWVVLANLTGCGLTPDMYKMPPAQLEQIRDDLGTIGVAVSDGPGEQKILVPAKGIGTLLEVRVEKTGLRGLYGIDPPTRLFIELDVRLIRVKDNQVLLSERISCTSEEPKRYVEWAEHAGKRIVDEFFACVPELAEKVVDDFFLVYPTVGAISHPR